MTDVVYANGDTVTYHDGTIATFGDSTTAHVDTNDRVIMQPVPKLPAGVKPTGPQEINWDHPLARNLAYTAIDGNEITTGLVLNNVERENKYFWHTFC